MSGVATSASWIRAAAKFGDTRLAPIATHHYHLVNNMASAYALAPEGETVTVQPEKMVELLSQWANHQRTGMVVVPLKVQFELHEIEFVPVRILNSPNPKRPAGGKN